MRTDYKNSLRLMTYNIGGGRRDQDKKIENCIQVIDSISPDILGLQEANFKIHPTKGVHSDTDDVANTLGYKYRSFHDHITLKKHFSISNTKMVDAIYDDYDDWQVGNSLISKLPFISLSDPFIDGQPKIIPIYKTQLYEGNRDTEPRFASLSRIKFGEINPYLITTHLSTLRGERGQMKQIEIYEKAVKLRKLEIQNIIALLEKKVLNKFRPVILMGDFNAEIEEDSLATLRNAGFSWSKPDGVCTHQVHNLIIDHIFCFPSTSVKFLSSKIIDTPFSREASDHLPVVAEVRWH